MQKSLILKKGKEKAGIYLVEILKNLFTSFDLFSLNISHLQFFPTPKIYLIPSKLTQSFQTKKLSSFLLFPLSLSTSSVNIAITHQHQSLSASIFPKNLLVEMEFQLSYFKSWKMMLWRCCTQYASKFGKLSRVPGLEMVSFHSNPKERQC